MAQSPTSLRCYSQSAIAHLNFPRERRIAATTAEKQVVGRSHVATGRREIFPSLS